MLNSRTILAATSLTTALALGACSSSTGSSGGAGGGSHGGPTVGPTRTSAAASGARTGTGSSSQPAGGAAAGGGAAWCRELAGAGDAIPALGGNSTDSPSAYKAKLARLVADAPGELRSDLQVLEKIDDRVADGDAKAEDEITQPATLARVRRLASWMQRNCRGSITDLPSLPG